LDDLEAMHQAMALGDGVRAWTAPNPWVGCIVEATDGRIFEGATEPPGGRHAEVVALDAAGASARGATAWVTLEPCAHHGRTGPCADALIAAGVARVVIGLEDPDARVAGRGIERLRAAGVAVDVGVAHDAVRNQLAPYVKHRTTGRPWVVLKMAASVDGRTAAPDGSSQWITGGAARADVHRLRAESGAVVVGAGTVRADDPALTVRDAEGPDPIRVVLGSVPPGARVQPALEHHGDLGELLDALGQRGVLQLLVEGGPTVAGSFHRAGLVDHYVFYLAPALFGGEDAAGIFRGGGAPTIHDVWRGAFTAVTQLGGDVRLDVSPVAPSPVTGPVPVVRLGEIPPVAPHEEGA
jgi:diaminohydroxyphosphoribosylaminopyrimidine deaminase/5-amino-6-(5-phosphoribosylamino)uracil reductase